MSSSTYPVRVDAHLDSGLSRWLWLVKWLLVLPHYLVLAFLWLAFAVLSVVAFVAILFTGRYPRGIFDFNVGVLRWSWRVAYYAYGALGTDRYPPFTLSEVPDYPAHLEVDYPEHLSRGLVLVKWWLLAIPHYLVIGIFLGGGVYVANEVAAMEPANLLWGGGLIGLLVLVAAAVLLFTGRYPQPIYDLVLGLNRWVLRVAAYAGLMTDQYPPFRLDQGGDDPAGGALTFSTGGSTAPTSVPDVSTTPATSGHEPPSPRKWGAGRVVLVVFASLVLLLSLGLGAGGAALLGVDVAARDDDGFVMSGDEYFATDSYALTSESMTIHSDAPTSLVPESLVGDGKLEVAGTDDTTLFVGVAATDDLAAYLEGVRHAEVVDLRTTDSGDVDPVYDVSGRHAPATPPADADIWSAQATGTGTVSLVWPAEEGDWTVVVMNADGSSDVTADVAVGATLPWLGWAAAVLLVGAGIGLLLAGLMLVAALRAPRTGGSR